MQLTHCGYFSKNKEIKYPLAPSRVFNEYGFLSGIVFSKSMSKAEMDQVSDDFARAALRLKEIGFDGYAIGGLSVGETEAERIMILDHLQPQLPEDRPRYLMGVGRPDDLVGAVARGIDMFDCVMPTRSGRTGKAFTKFGDVNIRNARHQEDPRPIQDDCRCPACRNHSRAYLHHLFKADEMLGPRLLSLHTLHFYGALMREAREMIRLGRLDGWVETTLAEMDAQDEVGD